MKNRSQTSGQRTAICHFSLVICHLSLVGKGWRHSIPSAPPLPCRSAPLLHCRSPRLNFSPEGVLRCRSPVSNSDAPAPGSPAHPRSSVDLHLSSGLPFHPPPGRLCCAPPLLCSSSRDRTWMTERGECAYEMRSPLCSR